MKRKIAILFCVGLCAALSAQTYKNGTWYSFYDEGSHELNTISNYETGSVIFAPTAQKLQFNWKYTKVDLFGVFSSNNTKIYESADGGSSTQSIGTLTDKTWDNEHSENLNISANINWLKWDRPVGNTHKVTIYNLKIALAQHILLEDGTYGTSSKSYDFGELDALSTSEAYTIHLRSFLSAGDITVHSSDPENFRLGSADNTADIVYAVGANACASANGKADAASEGTLGKISNYDVVVYFTPQEGKEYNGTITISDGVSTATVTVSGVGRKLAQTITWEPETPVLSNATISAAVASSGLDVAYAFEPEGVLAVENGVLTIVGEGAVTVTASQAGNTVYEAAEPVVRAITVFPAVTDYAYSAAICAGESYSDEHFTALTEQGLYYDTIKNVYGGDSILCLTLTVNPVYLFEQNDTIYEGDAATWQNIDMSVLPAGDTTLVVRYEALTTCDSTYVLHLTVLHPTTYGAYLASFCEGDSVLFEGVWYKEQAEADVLLAEKNHKGGDSIVHLTVAVHPPYAFDESKTIHMRDVETWQGIDLSVLPVGDTTLLAAYQSIYGCDSVYTLTLTVLRPLITTYGHDTINLCAGERAEYEGKIYRRPAKDSVLLAEPNQYGGDSIVELVVNVFPAMRTKASQTITEGDEIEWQGIDLSTMPVGDTTLTVTYTTIHGCDSIYILNLEVIAKTPTALDSTDGVEEKPFKFFRNGMMYIRKNGQVYNLQGIKIKED